MKIIPKNIVHKSLLPVPIYSAIYVAEAIGKDGEDYNIFIGLEKKYVEQLKKYSLDENDVDLQNNTGDKMRFGVGSYEEWYNKNRTPFCLIHTRTDTLAALVWYGPKTLGKKSIKFGEETKDTLESNWHTIAVRSYPPFRGKGLMREFISFTKDVYKRNFPSVNFWIGCDAKNKGMLALAEALGFEMYVEYSDSSAGWLVLTKRNNKNIVL